MRLASSSYCLREKRCYSLCRHQIFGVHVLLDYGSWFFSGRLVSWFGLEGSFPFFSGNRRNDNPAGIGLEQGMLPLVLRRPSLFATPSSAARFGMSVVYPICSPRHLIYLKVFNATSLSPVSLVLLSVRPSIPLDSTCISSFNRTYYTSPARRIIHDILTTFYDPHNLSLEWTTN